MRLLCVTLCALVCAMSTIANPEMSFESLETLLNLGADVTITSLKENIVPIYRKDLTNSRPAYWEVVINKEDFVLISDGPATGDEKLVFEGRLPSFTSILNKKANGRCTKYFMAAPDGAMICEDSANRKIAANFKQSEAHVRHTVLHNKNLENYEKLLTGQTEDKSLSDIIDSNIAEFTTRAEETAKNYIWLNVLSPRHAVGLSVGETVNIPVDLSVRIYGESDSKLIDICAAISPCPSKESNEVDDSHIKTTSYGIRYIPLALSSVPDKTLTLKVVSKWKARTIVRTYITESGHTRQKRQTSPWTYKSIPQEHRFPDYNQFKYGSCAVGCGPVAWASVFGYLDRRSHYHVYNPHCKKLYRSGSDGMSGSDAQIAPSLNDNRMKNYIRKLNKILKTFCLFGSGATFAKRMDRVKSFYTSRVPGGKIHLHRNWFTTLLGIYKDKYRNYAINYIKDGFPAIIGWRGGKLFAQHYPIATKYRYRTRKVKKTTGWWLWKKTKWVTVTDRQFYLHMGWGGSKNGWYLARAYFTAAATY